MLTWLGYIDGIHVTIYGSTMDPSWGMKISEIRFCHRSLWAQIPGPAPAPPGGAPLRSVCGWPYWLFGEHFWGRTEEAVLTFWQLGSWPVLTSWKHQVSEHRLDFRYFQMISDSEPIFSEWLIPLTNWEWFMIVLPTLIMFRSSSQRRLYSRMFQGRHSGEIEFIDLHRDPYTNKCKVLHQQYMQWKNAAILSEISINQSRLW